MEIPSRVQTKRISLLLYILLDCCSTWWYRVVWRVDGLLREWVGSWVNGWVGGSLRTWVNVFVPVGGGPVLGGWMGWSVGGWVVGWVSGVFRT